ncbi:MULTISPECIES: hypothetical protein [Thalassospira]|uniref:Uncharacterized protein n=1 Tax=Thalassospira tepidiphila TaxID=393657 RepID=A0ABX0WX95_9PROT|nr:MULTISPECIES: hypothetical protein [Thalassospira]MBE72362.1 hypothetical protein [Thalassospira sp.]MBO6577937.1 hypothetical protein [Thalassospira sp.]MBO6817239.1 hypothetical protein [Thalassospira sp.]NJB73916.1 hypothetical protein [Thalassospira tepidiphila]QPO11195.1 hypothetical protein IT893_15750 [Thalassospira sp. A40-3]
MKYKILLTARDPAAALHLIEIAKCSRNFDDLHIDIVTQQPASRYFDEAGFLTTVVDLPPAKEMPSVEGENLLQKSRDLIDSLKPDAVLSGLSTPFDGGLDEAITAVFKGPKFVMQDFWGEANQFFGARAQLYFALDDEAVRLSENRHGLNAVSVGSPRHSAYQSMDINAIREKERRRIGASKETTVVGFYGQALHWVKGYRNTLNAWVDAMIAQKGEYKALYRPHPREDKGDIRWTVQRFADAGMPCVICQGQDVEHSLLTCDVVCSAFSNCTYDVAYLNYFSEVPLITPVSLFFDPEIIDYFHKMVKLDEFPYLKSGLVLAINDVRDLSSVLALAGSKRVKEKYWSAAKHLPSPIKAPEIVLNHIHSSLVATNAR